MNTELIEGNQEEIEVGDDEEFNDGYGGTHVQHNLKTSNLLISHKSMDEIIPEEPNNVTLLLNYHAIGKR